MPRRQSVTDYEIKDMPHMIFSETYHPTTDTWTVQRVVERGVVEPWVSVKTSSIPGAGHGVFADRDFAQGQVLAYYTGGVIDMAHRPNIENTYLFDLETENEEMVVDGNRCGNFTRFLNDGAIDEYYRPLSAAKSRENVAFIETGAIYALCDIPEGDEIFISYGADYWEELRLKHRRRSSRRREE